MCDYSLSNMLFPSYLSVRQLEPPAEYLTALVLSILMINSFSGTHNISVSNSAELSLVIIRIWAILNRVWGSRVMKCKAKLLDFTAEVYVSFYCLLLEALGTVAIKYL